MDSTLLDSEIRSGSDEPIEFDFSVRDPGLVQRAAVEGAHLVFSARALVIEGQSSLEYQADLLPGLQLSSTDPSFLELQKKLRTTMKDPRVTDVMQLQTHAFDPRYRSKMGDEEISEYAAGELAACFRGLYEEEWGKDRVVPGRLVIRGTNATGSTLLAASSKGKLDSTVSASDLWSRPKSEHYGSELVRFLEKGTRIPGALDRAAIWRSPSNDVAALPSPNLTKQEVAKSVERTHARLSLAFAPKNGWQRVFPGPTDVSAIAGPTARSTPMNQSGCESLSSNPSSSQESATLDEVASGSSFPDPVLDYRPSSLTGNGSFVKGCNTLAQTDSGQRADPTHESVHQPSSQFYPIFPATLHSSNQLSGNLAHELEILDPRTVSNHAFTPDELREAAWTRAHGPGPGSLYTYGQGAYSAEAPQWSHQVCQSCIEGVCAFQGVIHTPAPYWGR